MPKISDEKKKQRQRDILKTALKLFSQKGYYATSIDDITYFFHFVYFINLIFSLLISVPGR